MANGAEKTKREKGNACDRHSVAQVEQLITDTV